MIMKKKAPYEWEFNETWNVCILCISYEWNAKKSMIMKRDSLMCTSYEWGFMHSLNGILSSYVYEKERSLCLICERKFSA